jgi:hypothetical protein
MRTKKLVVVVAFNLSKLFLQFGHFPARAAATSLS